MTDELIAKVMPGMTLEEVNALFGEPIQWECYRKSREAVQVTSDGVCITTKYRPTQLDVPTILLSITYHKPRYSDPIFCLTTDDSRDWLGRTRIFHVTFFNGKVDGQEIRPATILHPLWGWIETKYRDWTQP